MVWILAFSVQDQVEKYGAYVGVASFLGLALLSILYFAQAREVRRLRDWAGRAPERDAELEARVTSQAEVARRAPSRPVEPVRRPAVAAVGTLSQETQITPPPTPIATPAGNGRTPAVPMGPRPAAAAAAVAAAVAAATAGREEAQEPEEQATQPAAATATVPAAPAAAPAESDGDTGEEAAAETNGNGNGTGTGEAVAIPRATPRPVPPARRPAQPLRASERSTTVPPRRPTPRAGVRAARPATPPPAQPRGRSRGVLLGVLAGVVVLAVAAVLITTLGGGDGGTPAPNTTEPASTSTPSGSSSAAAGGPARADTVVVILNGTTTDGLAAQAKTSLEDAGYTSSNIPTDTANNQATPTSTVYYAPGRRRQALAVSRTLEIDQVAAVTSDIQTLADNSSDPPVKADVVTILGADRTP